MSGCNRMEIQGVSATYGAGPHTAAHRRSAIFATGEVSAEVSPDIAGPNILPKIWKSSSRSAQMLSVH